MYSNVVLNVFNNPKNTGRISKPDGIASCFNFDNTAHVEFSLRVESGVITKCQFRAQANPYIIAICSTITEMLKGKMVPMVFLDPYSIKKELGDERDDDITFCIDCVKMAIDDYKEKLEIALNDGKKPSKRKSKEKAEKMAMPETSVADEEDLPEVIAEDSLSLEDNAAESDNDTVNDNEVAEAADEEKPTEESLTNITTTEEDESNDFSDDDDDFDFSDFFDEEI